MVDETEWLRHSVREWAQHRTGLQDWLQVVTGFCVVVHGLFVCCFFQAAPVRVSLPPLAPEDREDQEQSKRKCAMGVALRLRDVWQGIIRQGILNGEGIGPSPQNPEAAGG